MGLDFVERFFKLTLDNVYRFTCSLLFGVALFAYAADVAPATQLAGLLDWLAIPSAWLNAVGSWLDQRQVVVGVVATLTLLVAIAFAATNDWHSRSGSTALLSTVILMQVGQGAWTLTAAIIVIACLITITGLAAYLAVRLGWETPEWTRTVWEKTANVMMTLVLAASYLFSPLGWLISQEPYNVRGTRWNPLYIEQVERTGPTGAVTLR
ncbi:hypothetical protein ACIPJ1_06310 [Microbacterium maritypicum]|uniref:hypothetical protein n=1 Tax=Microbacterium maritypicum TaxID=33918 RepID=UPI0038069E4B